MKMMQLIKYTIERVFEIKSENIAYLHLYEPSPLLTFSQEIISIGGPEGAEGDAAEEGDAGLLGDGD